MYIEYSYNSVIPDNTQYAQYLDPVGEDEATITEAKLLIVNDIFELLTNSTPNLSRFCAGYSIEGSTTIGWTPAGGDSSDSVMGNSAMTIASMSSSTYSKIVTISTVDDKTPINQGFAMVSTPIINDLGALQNIPVGILSEQYANTTAMQLRFIVADGVNNRTITQSTIDYCEFYANGGTIFISAANTHLIVSSMSNSVIVSETSETVSIKSTFGVSDYDSMDPEIGSANLAQFVYFNSTSFGQIIAHGGGSTGYVYPAGVFDSSLGSGTLDDMEPPPFVKTAKGLTMSVRYQSAIHDNNLHTYNSDLVETKYAAPVIVDYDQTVLGVGGQTVQAAFTGLTGIYGPDGTMYSFGVMTPPGSVILRNDPYIRYLIGIPSEVTNYKLLGGSISEKCGLYILPSIHAGIEAYQTLVYNGKKYVTWPHTFTNSYANIMIEVK
jgi:hypothetical protein